MPLCTLHLLSLHPTTSLPHDILPHLHALNPPPLTIARPLRWIITPTTLSTHPLLTHPWHLLLILPTAAAAAAADDDVPTALPAPLHPHIAARFTLTFGLPARLLSSYAARNARLLHPQPSSVPPLSPLGAALRDGTSATTTTASSAQGLELSGELLGWMRSGDGPTGAVSMLNLLAFAEGKKGEYLKYGRAFAEDVGVRRGGVAKVVGRVVGEGQGWDEVALAHYPSVWHFADMLAGADYQAANRRYRVGSLRDTIILCTTELGLEGGKAAKL